jgi:hypothetical protein
MKHILPILTLALLGAAATAFADNFYYEYYKGAALGEVNTVSDNDVWWPNHFDTDSVTYGITEENKTGEFTVARNSNWNSPLSPSAKSNFYRIEVNKNGLELYLTDFVKGIYEDTMSYNSTSNALFNMNITQYGYRELTLGADGKYTAGKPQYFDIFDSNGNLNKENVTKIDTIKNDKGEEVARYKYALGTFKKDTVIELCMKDSEGREAYSYSYQDGVDAEDNIVYTPFDPTTYAWIESMQGGFGEGGYHVDAIQTDDMLDSYYFPDRKDYKPFDSAKTPAAQKAMPLSQLIPTTGGDVSFGIIAMTDGMITGGYKGTVGSPLPGGLQIALIAGLFGLGFWYVRRRKAVAA